MVRTDLIWYLRLLQIEVLQILGVSLTDTTHLVDLFDRTKSQNFDVLSDPNGPNLFNF